MAKNKVVRWLLAVAILLTGILASFYVAEWLQTVLRLPSFTIISRRGSATDLVVLALAICLLIGYLYIVPKLLRVSHEEMSRMMRGE
ncbi:hypothetical protein [Roseateles saccharophilus]|uniref:Uncharacterized protein n=1 Tax=Roseateles saccharophilus TaxID=304 RepID=A0A4R3VDW2_ROSSA|nr:hypothetical protein [Roseateles saccharophilus]MDG0832135.1 hypothetical protein [Roseateles saccharophilus]TCV03547.1 hypothetical protein EV671_1003202 [Roseateles saccharophilus]